MKKKYTYALLQEPEEKRSLIFETIVYGLVVVCTAITVWFFLSSAVTLPGMNRADSRQLKEKRPNITPKEPDEAVRGLAAARSW